MLFDPAGSSYQVSKWTAFGMAALLSMFTAFLIVKIAQARRRPVTVGVHQLVGEHGQVRHGGFVFLNGRAVAGARRRR